MITVGYRCRSVRCEGKHASPSHVCKSVAEGGDGVFVCERIRPPCPTHASGAHACKETGEPNAWSCGRVEPPCPGHPSRSPDVRCGAGLWQCARVTPPCLGHRRPGLTCGAPTDDAPRAKSSDAPALAPRTLSVGVNLPWSFQYCGYDFGVAPRGWRHRHPSPRRWDEEIGATLDRIADVGLEVVRFWVLADGVAYPENDAVDRWLALAPENDGKTLRARLRDDAPEPAPLTDAFVDDLRSLLDALNERGLRAIPSFVSFEAFFPGHLTNDGTLKDGRRALLLGRERGADRAWIERFLAATLDRLLAIRGPAGEPTHPAVLAWEVVNEPEWPVRKSFVEPEAMSLFLECGVERIVRSGHRASIGFVDDATPWLTPSFAAYLRELAREELYLHQFHYYPRTLGPTCRRASATAMPGSTIVGELAMQDSVSSRWRDSAVLGTELEPSRYLTGRLECLDQLGYSLALLWSIYASDDKSGWDDEARAQIRAFTARRTR